MTLETLTNTGFRQAAVYQRFAKFEHHFAGVNKMVPARHPKRHEGINAEVRELEAKIAENVVELLEA
jgi:hypothetical protein